MPRIVVSIIVLTGLILSTSVRAEGPPKFALRDGDRVVLIGDALVEREQEYGYLETMLTLQNPDKTITFRNLGWSGDTVFGDARAGFGTRADGFRNLVDHVLALKPTVIVVGYGMSDSFEGMKGLPPFVAGLNALLDALGPARARVVLMTPIAHEALGKPFPDPTAHNEALGHYADAIGDVAEARGCHLVHLFHPDLDASHRLTDDGIHPTARGYFALDTVIASELGVAISVAPWRLDLRVEGESVAVEAVEGVKVAGLGRIPGGLRFEATPASAFHMYVRETMRVAGLPDGNYTLKVNGEAIETADARHWKDGEVGIEGPEFDQIEQLRDAIHAKNRLYFHRWRPENETYLFGFRKKEQGNNAREIPLFDPLVEEKEREIARLRTPVAHVYELLREESK